MPSEQTSPLSSECEEPIRQTGWGLYHYFMIGMASACAFSQASALASVPFAAPLAACSMHPTSAMLLAIDTCFSLGMAFGSLLLSCLSDLFGRKFMISTSLVLMFSSNFAAGFAHKIYIIMILVFFLGSGLAANANCVKIHLAEILPAEKRGSCLVFVDVFWTCGYITASGIDYLLTPNAIPAFKGDVKMEPWRLMFALSSTLSILVACASALTQQSPRYLLYQKKYPEALSTLKKMYAINNSKYCDTYKLRERDLMGRVDQFRMDEIEDRRLLCSETMNKGLQLKKRVFLLFTRRFLVLTIFVICLKVTVAFGMLSANLWLARILKYGDKSSCSITGVDLMHIETMKSNCRFKLDEDLYKHFFLLALTMLVGQIVLIFLIDRVGRKICVVVGFLLCALSAVGLAYVVDSYSSKFFVASIFMMSFSMVDSTLNVLIYEAYPTAIRGTAAGCTQFFPIFLAAVFKIFINMSCQTTHYVFGTILLFSGILGLFIPELGSKPMVE